MFSRITLLSALAASVLVCIPTISEAQFGVRIGGGGGGGYRNGYYGNGLNRYGSGYGNPAWGRSGITVGIGSGYYGNGYNRGGFYNSGLYNGLYNNRYGYRGNYPSNYSTYDNSPTIYGASPTELGLYRSSYPSSVSESNVAPSVAQNGTASILVIVPANAQLWWNGSPGTVMGETRRFRTGPLSAEGSTQSFQARWMGSDGQPVTQSREIRVTPNENFTVDFRQPQAPDSIPENR